MHTDLLKKYYYYFKFTSNIMLSFTNSQYQWRTMQTGHWDSAKGDHDHLKEVKITINKG